MTSGTPSRMSAWLESAWLARYLDRQLDGEELAWFEAYLMDKSDLLDIVETDNRLRDVLAQSERKNSLATGETGALAMSREDSPTSPERKGMPSAPMTRRVAHAFPMAAAVLLGVGIGWLGFRTERPVAPDPIIGSPTRIVFDTMRGSASLPAVDHRANTAAWLMIEVAVPEDARDVRLHVGDVTSETLVPSSDGFVSVLVARSLAETSDSAGINYQLAGAKVERALPLKQELSEKRK